MYIYFDTNGTIKEIVNDKSIRNGSNEANKIYCYLEGEPEIDDIWYLQKLPSGELSNEVSFKNSTITKAIPYDAKRDMKYFKDFEQYTFYVFTLNTFLTSQKGLNIATIRVSVDNTIWALGELTFNVQENVINVDNGITQSQYDYLLLAYASRTLNEQVGRNLNDLIDDKIEAKIGDLASGSPKVFDTEYNIEHNMHDDEGIAVATDTGDIWVWNDTQQEYVNTNYKYIADVSLFYTKTESDNKYAPKSNAVTHTGNQLQDYSGNNIYPNLDDGQVTYENCDIYVKEQLVNQIISKIKNNDEYSIIPNTNTSDVAKIYKYDENSNITALIQNENYLNMLGFYTAGNGIEVIYNASNDTFNIKGQPTISTTFILSLPCKVTVPNKNDSYMLEVDRDFVRNGTNERLQFVPTTLNGTVNGFLVWNDLRYLVLDNTKNINGMLFYIRLDTSLTYNITFKLRVTHNLTSEFVAHTENTIKVEKTNFNCFDNETNITYGNYGNLYIPTIDTVTQNGFTFTYKGQGVFNIKGTPSSTTMNVDFPVVSLLLDNSKTYQITADCEDKNNRDFFSNIVPISNTTPIVWFPKSAFGNGWANLDNNYISGFSKLNILMRYLSTSTYYDFNIKIYITALDGSVQDVIGAKIGLYTNEKSQTIFNELCNTMSFTDIKNKYRYLALSFIGSTKNALCLLGSNNLHHFDLLKTNIFTITDGLAMRDPAVIKIGEWFYLTYGLWNYSGGNTIGFAKTKDFVNFEELTSLKVTDGIQDAYQIWAPCWFREKDDIYIVAGYRIGDSNNITDQKTIICKYHPDTHTLDYGDFLDGTGGIIDIHIYKENGYYYAIGSTPFIFKSSSLLGQYTQVTQGTGYTGEGQYCVKLGNRWWLSMQLYYNANNNYKHNIVYTLADTLESFTITQQSDWTDVTFDAKGLHYQEVCCDDFTHWTIYDLYEDCDNNNNFL